MKNFLLFFGIVMCCITAYATSLTNKKAPLSLSKSSSLHSHALSRKAKIANTTVTLTRGSNVSGSYRIIFISSSGEQQYPFPPGGGSTQITVPSGVYPTVGIAPAGGGSSSYNFSGSACTNNYSANGSSATFSNVTLTCSSASFSIN
jgi:hypothetical protein